MLRPSIFALTLVAVCSLTGCSTIYRDTYSPKRNYFKPEPEEPRPTEVLPPAAAPSEQPPALPPAVDVPGM